MTDKDQQIDRLREAVQRKMADSDAAARADRPVTGGAPPEVDEGAQASLTEPGRTQDAFSVRAKNSQKGKKAAENWNQ